MCGSGGGKQQFIMFLIRGEVEREHAAQPEPFPIQGPYPPPPKVDRTRGRGGSDRARCSLLVLERGVWDANTKVCSSSPALQGFPSLHTSVLPSFALSKMVRCSALPAALVVLASSSCTAFVAPLSSTRVSTPAMSMSLKGPSGRSSSPASKAAGIVSKASVFTCCRCYCCC